MAVLSCRKTAPERWEEECEHGEPETRAPSTEPTLLTARMTAWYDRSLVQAPGGPTSHDIVTAALGGGVGRWGNSLGSLLYHSQPGGGALLQVPGHHRPPNSYHQTPSTGAPRAVAAPGPSPVLSRTRVTTRSGKQNPALLGQGLPRTCTRWARGQVAETTGSRESGLNSASPSDPKSSLAPRANRPSLLLTSLSSDRPRRRQRDKGGCLPRRPPLGRDEQVVHQDRRAARAPTRKQTPGHCPRMAGPKLWGPLTLPGISMVT